MASGTVPMQFDYEDVSSKFTPASGNSLAHSQFRRIGNMIFFDIQTNGKVWANGDVIGTFDAGYRPTTQVFFVCTNNTGAYGLLSMEDTQGKLSIFQLNTNPSGRIYCNGWFAIA